MPEKNMPCSAKSNESESLSEGLNTVKAYVEDAESCLETIKSNIARGPALFPEKDAKSFASMLEKKIKKVTDSLRAGEYKLDYK